MGDGFSSLQRQAIFWANDGLLCCCKCASLILDVLTWHQWLGARLQYLQCISNGDFAVLHYAIDVSMSCVSNISVEMMNICLWTQWSLHFCTFKVLSFWSPWVMIQIQWVSTLWVSYWIVMSKLWRNQIDVPNLWLIPVELIFAMLEQNSKGLHHCNIEMEVPKGVLNSVCYWSLMWCKIVQNVSSHFQFSARPSVGTVMTQMYAFPAWCFGCMWFQRHVP